MHYAEQVWAKRAEENERCRNIGTTIDICRRLGEYLEKSHKKISPPHCTLYLRFVQRS